VLLVRVVVPATSVVPDTVKEKAPVVMFAVDPTKRFPEMVVVAFSVIVAVPVVEALPLTVKIPVIDKAAEPVVNKLVIVVAAQVLARVPLKVKL
jgi:hypothetical protein